MNLKSIIIKAMEESANIRGTILKEELSEKSILLESGLDSLGYAIVITKLEDDLGYDPFTIMEEAFYPATLGELIEVYEKYKPE